MQYLYHPDSSAQSITIEGESYNHLFKSRRQKKESHLHTRNLKDNQLYTYRIEMIGKKSASLTLESSIESIIEADHALEIIWCIIDPKEIEKTLPALNEMGVAKITFVYCDYSQSSYKLDLERLNRLLINSSQQCGRSSIIELSIEPERPLEYYHDSLAQMLDFGGETIESPSTITQVIIGCEGGFSEEERSLNISKIGLKSPSILRSTSAILATASKILL
jgi:16S rRNA (uracil1498-N3)-methyltransferase